MIINYITSKLVIGSWVTKSDPTEEPVQHNLLIKVNAGYNRRVKKTQSNTVPMSTCMWPGRKRPQGR